MSLHLVTPDVFPAFPYVPPYSIQTHLMRHIYESIENRAVTLVESPTGTVRKPPVQLMVAPVFIFLSLRERPSACSQLLCPGSMTKRIVHAKAR